MALWWKKSKDQDEERNKCSRKIEILIGGLKKSLLKKYEITITNRKGITDDFLISQLNIFDYMAGLLILEESLIKEIKPKFIPDEKTIFKIKCQILKQALQCCSFAAKLKEVICDTGAICNYYRDQPGTQIGILLKIMDKLTNQENALYDFNKSKSENLLGEIELYLTDLPNYEDKPYNSDKVKKIWQNKLVNWLRKNLRL